MDSVLDNIRASMDGEVTAIEKQISDIQSQRQELEKAMKLTEVELYRLEGRLTEAKAVVAFIQSKLPTEEVEEETEIVEESPTMEN